MQKIFFLLLFFLLGFFGKSQKIQVFVKNEKGENLDNINVQLLKDQKIIDFQKTDGKGGALFENTGKNSFQLKFTSIYYKTKILNTEAQDNPVLHVVLEPQITDIAEVEIKSRPKIAFLRNDTISFNVKAIKDGTERTTEDLIRKIPGLDINDSGKVTYKGNTVGQVLVEGNDFFGKNHKLSTQNISSEMIEGIDFLKNFTTIAGNTSTALNLKIKDEFKGKINGNVEGGYGTADSYIFHANLFKLGKSGNLAFVGDANSIAKNPINDVDFYEMNSNEDLEHGTNIEVPSFLNNDGLVESKANQLGALQYSKSNDKFSITAFSVINNAQLKKLSSTSRTAFEGQPQDFNFFENKKESNDGFLGIAQIKIKKVFDDKSFLFLNSGYNPTEDNFTQTIERYSTNNQKFDIRNKIQNSSFNNNLSWNKALNNFNVVLALKTTNESYKEYLGINSDKDLFLINNTALTQYNQINSRLYAIDFQLKNNNRWLNFNIASGAYYRRDNSELSTLENTLTENRNLKIDHYINRLELNRKIWKFNISTSVGSHLLDINDKKRSYFENSFKVKFLPTSKVNTEYEFEYKTKYREPELKLLFYNPFFTKYLTYSQNISVVPDAITRTDNYKLTWSKFNISNGNIMFLILSYDRTKPNFTTNVINYGTFSAIENRLGDFNERWFLFFSHNQKLNKSLTLKSKLLATSYKNNNFIDYRPNTSTSKTIEWSQKISSNFKNIPVQFDFGYSLNRSLFNQSFYATNTELDNTKFSLGLRTNIKKEWICNVLGEYLIQKSVNNSLQNFLLGGQFSYRKEKSRLEYNVLFSNILNLNSFNYINSFAGQAGTEEQSMTALHGYILGGLKIHF